MLGSTARLIGVTTVSTMFTRLNARATCPKISIPKPRSAASRPTAVTRTVAMAEMLTKIPPRNDSRISRRSSRSGRGAVKTNRRADATA